MVAGARGKNGKSPLRVQMSFWGDEYIELVVMAAQPCQDTKTTEMYFKMVNFVVRDLYLSKKRGRGSRNAEKGFVLTEEQ